MSNPNQGALAPQLPPLPYPLGVLEPYYATESTTLVLRQKLSSWSANDFEIKTLAGEPFLKVEGKTWSLSRKISVTDMQGAHLFTLRQDPWSWRGRFYAEGPTGLRFLNVDGSIRCKCLAVFPLLPRFPFISLYWLLPPVTCK